jgi:tripeptide aminopeptidase
MLKQKLLERFLRYISMDTQSDPNSATFPSTAKQFDLLRMLADELKGFGIEDAHMDEHGYVMATLPSNTEKGVPVIGFLAHVDSSPDMAAANIRAQVIENYPGGDVLLNRELGMYMKVADFPDLENYKGQTLITTDGTTLLSADDKAGIAEIMTAVEFLCQHPEIKHGTIKIGFTPDEEIGRGVDYFDVKKFGAQYAYTLDGGEIGELEYENFNAAFARVQIQGRNIHPGTAKGKMKNAILIGHEFNEMLPVFERPEHTDGYEGFFHITKFDGVVEQADIQYIVRDHDHQLFEDKKQLMRDIAAFMNRKYGEGTIQLHLNDQYYNMREKVEPVYHIVAIAEKAIRELGIEPIIKPIRGGTDGSRLSYMGLPCPNIFAGGHNFHGKYEYIPLESMEKATQVILKVIELFEEN